MLVLMKCTSLKIDDNGSFEFGFDTCDDTGKKSFTGWATIKTKTREAFAVGEIYDFDVTNRVAIHAPEPVNVVDPAEDVPWPQEDTYGSDPS
jgi:hypothetical protein